MIKKLLLLVLFVCAPLPAAAAVLSLSAQPAALGVGDVVRVMLSVDSDEAVNAFSGSIIYPPALLQPVAVLDGSSIVSVWLTHPQLAAGSSVVPFAGLTAGGYSGKGGELFSIIFRVVAAGTPRLLVRDAQVLRNDGAGSAAKVTLAPLNVVAAALPQGGYVEQADTAAPEAFEAYLGTGAQVEGAQPYLVFSAQDKASGIDHYEFAQRRAVWFWSTLSWSRVESPLPLNVDLVDDVYIKAIDRAGNERMATFTHRHWLRPQEVLSIAGILIVLLLAYGIRRYLCSTTH